MNIKNNKANQVYVKKIPYVLRALCFGFLGWHEFYAGRKRRGLTMLGIFILLIILLIATAPFKLFGFFPAICLSLLVIYIIFIEIQTIRALFSPTNQNGEIQL